MNELIHDLFEGMLKRNNPGEKISRETERAVLDILEGGRLDNQNYAELWDKVFMAASCAERNGFAEGFLCAAKLFLKCLIG